MLYKSFIFDSHDGYKLYLNKWYSENSGNYKGIVQIIHGMVEHSDRYADFAEELCSYGYIVYACDLRGHGRTAQNTEDIGHLPPHGWENILQDIHRINEYAKNEYKDIPVFIFGHSMGSFLARHYISLYGKYINGAIICGTGKLPKFLTASGAIIAKHEIKKYGETHRSTLLNKLSFGTYNKRINNPTTEFDWLTRDEAKVSSYIDDKLCGAVCTCGFYLNMFNGINELQNNKNAMAIPKDMPIFIISGKEDPVGNYGKAVIGLYKQYKKCGLSKIDYKLYEDCRHELLNEIDRQEVINDIIKWLLNVCK